MEMPMALMHAVEAKPEDDAGHDGRQMVTGVPPGERVRGEGAEQKRQKPDEVVGEYGISRQRVHRQAYEADAKQMLAVRQRLFCRIEDVGVEQGRDAVEPRMVVPG